MTREHLYFIPIVFFLGVAAGALLTRHRLVPEDRAAPSGKSAAVHVTLRGVFIPFVVFLLFFVLTHLVGTHGGPRAVSEALGGQTLFDVRPSTSAAEVYARMESFGAEGRAAYGKMTFTTDLVFPLVLLAFLVQLTRFVTERVSTLAPGLRAAFLLVPAAWLCADLTENALVHHLLSAFPVRHDAMAEALATVTNLKFALLVAAIAIPAVLAAAARESPTADTHPASP